MDVQEKNRKIAHANKRKAELKDWLLTHKYSHHQFEQNMRDMHIVEVELDRLNQSQATPGLRPISEEYSIPNFK